MATFTPDAATDQSPAVDNIAVGRSIATTGGVAVAAPAASAATTARDCATPAAWATCTH